MGLASQIPVFNLFGETGAFPDVVHCERIWDRARLHDWRIAPHRHLEMAQVFFMRRGEARVRVDGAATTLGDGDFQFIPARSVHDFLIGQGSEGLVLSFPLAVVSGLPPGPFHGAADARAVVLMDQLAETFGGTGAFRAPLLVALAQAVLAAVAEVAARRAEAVEPLALRRMRDFDQLLTLHLAQGWGAAEFASALGITPGHLNRICRAATGTHATRHIETARMTEARRLLAFTQLAVAEIGYRLGFQDPPYFSRRFRAVTGETPSAYRARFADVAPPGL
ncbi:helix-turn-helix domain-containing protein [Paenirhodobacter sp.]|uniref:helix-turn-helix domain-containing protein n=1 Tax=Paenirhodobacter sp. TaxID=1965326 RepID=UPI003B3C2913